MGGQPLEVSYTCYERDGENVSAVGPEKRKHPGQWAACAFASSQVPCPERPRRQTPQVPPSVAQCLQWRQFLEARQLAAPTHLAATVRRARLGAADTEEVHSGVRAKTASDVGVRRFMGLRSGEGAWLR